MAPTSRIEIDLTAIAGNVRAIRRILGAPGPTSVSGAAPAPPPGICAVLKADAYSMGAQRIAKRLGIAGVDMFAVYTPEQARALIDAAVTTPILLLMPIHEFERSDALYRAASRGQLHLTIHDAESVAAAATFTDSLGMTLALHLEIDTGMSRGGSSPDEALRLARRIANHPRLTLAGVFNHFACSDTNASFTTEQADRFSQWLAAAKDVIPPNCIIHEANTCGVFRSAGFHRSMVRVGLALFGYAGEEFGDPDNFEFRDEAHALAPAVRWVSQIVQTKRIDVGTPVGYGSTWRAKRPTRLALIPVGYADGYPLALSNKARIGVELAGGIRAFAPIVGRVSMDQITIDITDLPDDQVRIGTPVEILGADRAAPNHLPTLAAQAGMITHELLLRISARLPRHYIAVEKPSRPLVTGAVAV